MHLSNKDFFCLADFSDVHLIHLNDFRPEMSDDIKVSIAFHDR